MSRPLSSIEREYLATNEPAEAVIDALVHADGWMLDVDGCLVRTTKAGGAGGAAIEGAAQLLAWLRRHQRRFVICTNASQHPVSHYAGHLRDCGLDIADHELMTAATATADFVARHHAGARVLVLGDRGLSEAMRDAGLQLASSTDRNADVVAVGAADQYSSSTINAACLAVADRGASLYTSVGSPWFHGGVDRSVAVSSAMANAVAWVTGAIPQVCGKPSPALGEVLRERLGGSSSQLVVVGDAAGAEMKLAHQIDALGVLVLSGATMAKDLPGLPLDQRPHWVGRDVGQLLQQMRAVLP
ncbi:HAD-IIA family hydrolase [Eoetvoesiella caeni]|uniref:4-nitrophenyl phosphatase/NagD protein n=1 Tax=Eoetvoesiella caeni TaxID=645616 RepID=A0A366H9N7_9BURK|nr:HAD hydrolase-like protein [Eoetvoesiella caeni]MCI2809603.1 HAD hydrolase-like protein [Eoetvoesiella caeni]NYT56099.1 HAD hydrolase-like protein [Eoetvoesiella caeni]RBP38864.1 4-nitrophenyl phosphatase/NagD protein [Eoetvoesiella caeni]